MTIWGMVAWSRKEEGSWLWVWLCQSSFVPIMHLSCTCVCVCDRCITITVTAGVGTTGALWATTSICKSFLGLSECPKPEWLTAAGDPTLTPRAARALTCPSSQHMTLL